MLGILYRFASLLITLTLPLFITLASTRIVMTEPYLRVVYNRPDFPPDYYGMSQEERLQYAPYLLRYLLSNANVSYLADLRFSDGLPLFTQRELQHMVDVKSVFQLANKVLLTVIIGIGLLSLLLLLSRKGRAALRRGLSGGSILLLMNLALLIALIFVNWQQFFTSFHSLFFESGSWVFEYSDTLIRLFPIRFWQDTSVTIGIVSGVSALLILVGCLVWGRIDKARNTESGQ